MYTHTHIWREKELKRGKIFNSHCGGCMCLLIVLIFQLFVEKLCLRIFKGKRWRKVFIDQLEQFWLVLCMLAGNGEERQQIAEEKSRSQQQFNKLKSNIGDYKSLCDCHKPKATESQMGQGLAGRCGQWRLKQSQELFEGQEGKHEKKLL